MAAAARDGRKIGGLLLLVTAGAALVVYSLPRRAPLVRLPAQPAAFANGSLAALEKSTSGCNRCMAERCHEKHQCGRFFAEATGWERPYCQCACCRIQCGDQHYCHGVPPHAPGFPINVSTLTGSGSEHGASSFGALAALSLAPALHELLVADETNSAVRIVEPVPSGGRRAAVRTLRAEEGERPRGLAVLGSPPTAVLVADTLANVLRLVDLENGTVGLVVGSGEWDQIDGAAPEAAFASPNAVDTAPDGSFAVVADTENNAIRIVDLPSGAVRTLAGTFTEPPPETPVDAVGSAARFSQPMGVALSADGATAYVADTGFHLVRAVEIATGATRTLAGSGERGALDSGGHHRRVGDFHSPRSLCLEPGGGALLVADMMNHLIRRVDLARCHAGERCALRTLAGQAGRPGYRDGIAPAAQFNRPVGIDALPLSDRGDATGGEDAARTVAAYVADEGNDRIRRIVYDMAAV